MKEKIEQIEEQYGVKVLLMTKVGSHLYGTSTPESDTDYKGIFLPTKDSLLLDEALNFIDLSTNKDGTKNTKEDIDFTLSSVQSWAKQVFKGETGALDLLFSLWSEEAIEFVETEFEEFVKTFYKDMLCKKPQAFVGYANTQAKKYSLKKDRYQELQQVITMFTELYRTKAIGEPYTLASSWETIKKIVTAKDLKYTNFVMAPGPRKSVACEYIEILGRKFHPSVTFNEVLIRLAKVEKDYGNRAKGCETPTEWKSLSHAVRIVDEIEELLEKQFITFPLANAEMVKLVKAGKVEQEAVTAYMQDKLTHVDELMDTTTLPEEPNKKVFEAWLKQQYA